MLHRTMLTTLILGAMTLGLSTGTALARSPQSEQAMKSGATMQQNQRAHMRKRMPRMRMQGRHMMPATITSIDKKTGKVAVNSEGMDLMVHFPPSALADVNKGDEITLFLGFRKGDVKAMRKEHKMNADMMNKDMDHGSKDSEH